MPSKPFNAILTLLCAAVALLALPPAQAKPEFNAQPPSESELSLWGLERVAEYTNRKVYGGWPPKKKGFMLLGPEVGGQRLCVSLARITNPVLTCQQTQCTGLFKEYASKNLLILGQHVLVSRPCFGKQEDQPWVLYDNRNRDNWLDSSMMAFSAVYLSPAQVKARREAGYSDELPPLTWSQKLENGHYVVQFVNSEGLANLTWHEKEGYRMQILFDKPSP